MRHDGDHRDEFEGFLWGQVLLFGRTLDPQAVAAEVDAVTPVQLAALTAKVLAPRKAAVAVLGPKAALKAADTFEQALFA